MHFFDYFMGGQLYDPILYNCTGTSAFTEQKVFIGVVYLVIGIIAQITYILVLYVVYKAKSLICLPCYKIMFFLGITDVLCLTLCADFAGYYSIRGLHPCFSIEFTFITGCLVFGLWHMSCLCVLLLAFDRVCELIAPRISIFLFTQWRFKCLLFLPVLYFFYFTFFTKPTFFHSPVSAFLLNPMTNVTYNFSRELYTVEAYVFNNIFVMVFIGISYLLICCYLIQQSWSSKIKQTSSIVKRVTYQCLTVCTCHFVGCFLYVYIQYFWMPDFLNIVCHLAWIGNHSLPPMVYIIFNPTIRTDIAKIFGVNRKSSKTDNISAAKRSVLQAITI